MLARKVLQFWLFRSASCKFPAAWIRFDLNKKWDFIEKSSALETLQPTRLKVKAARSIVKSLKFLFERATRDNKVVLCNPIFCLIKSFPTAPSPPVTHTSKFCNSKLSNDDSDFSEIKQVIKGVLFWRKIAELSNFLLELNLKRGWPEWTSISSEQSNSTNSEVAVLTKMSLLTWLKLVHSLSFEPCVNILSRLQVCSSLVFWNSTRGDDVDLVGEREIHFEVKFSLISARNTWKLLLAQLSSEYIICALRLLWLFSKSLTNFASWWLTLSYPIFFRNNRLIDKVAFSCHILWLFDLKVTFETWCSLLVCIIDVSRSTLFAKNDSMEIGRKTFSVLNCSDARWKDESIIVGDIGKNVWSPGQEYVSLRMMPYATEYLTCWNSFAYFLFQYKKVFKLDR